MSTTTKRTPEIDLQSDVEALRRDFASLSSDIVTLLTDAVEQGKVSAQSARERLTQMASSGVEQAKARAADYGSQLDEQVKAHPLASLGIALGAGFLIGAWLRR